MNDFNLFDESAVPVHKFASDTELAAAEKIAPIAGKLRREVLEQITEAGLNGRTSKELGRAYAATLGRQPNDASSRYSCAPRCTELRDAGLIRDSGQRRESSIVWVAVGNHNQGTRS